MRKLKEGEVTADLFGFLTTDANAVVAPYHPKAMPVILERQEEIETWLTAPYRSPCSSRNRCKRHPFRFYEQTRGLAGLLSLETGN